MLRELFSLSGVLVYWNKKNCLTLGARSLESVKAVQSAVRGLLEAAFEPVTAPLEGGRPVVDRMCMGILRLYGPTDVTGLTDDLTARTVSL